MRYDFPLSLLYFNLLLIRRIAVRVKPPVGYLLKKTKEKNCPRGSLGCIKCSNKIIGPFRIRYDLFPGSTCGSRGYCRSAVVIFKTRAHDFRG